MVLRMDEIREPLRRWLAPVLAADARVDAADVRGLDVGGFERPAAGQSSDTILFTASWTQADEPHRQDLVLRRQPQGGIFLTPDAVREARILQGLEVGSRVPVPHVLAHESDPTLLGAPFFVMTKVAGRVPVAKPSIHAVGWLTELTTEARERLWRSALDVVVAIHDVDWRSTHAFLTDAEHNTTGLDAHVDRLVEWYEWTVDGRTFPITDAALDAIHSRRHSIGTGAPVLVWGDARPGNMIVGDDGCVAAAIDWEVATVGPAGIDLGHWLFFDAFATTAAGVDRLPGWPDRQATIDRYEQLSGRTIEDLEFYELLEEFFIATTLIRQADMRVTKGLAPPDTRMGHDNAVTQMIARRLDLPVPELSPDYIAHRRG
jgi:aminoglycoside phosphotransferase (APT) family kinase protein